MKGLAEVQKLLCREPWLPTPLLYAPVISDRLGVNLWLKREDCTRAGSFKIRGGVATMAQRGRRIPDAGVYVAAARNCGFALRLDLHRSRSRTYGQAERGTCRGDLNRRAPGFDPPLRGTRIRGRTVNARYMLQAKCSHHTQEDR